MKNFESLLQYLKPVTRGRHRDCRHASLNAKKSHEKPGARQRNEVMDPNYQKPPNPDEAAAQRIIEANKNKKIRVMGPMDFSAKWIPAGFSEWKTQDKKKR